MNLGLGDKTALKSVTIDSCTDGITQLICNAVVRAIGVFERAYSRRAREEPV
jgi:hypothetical protein